MLLPLTGALSAAYVAAAALRELQQTGKLAKLAARRGRNWLLRGVAYTVSENVIPPLAK